MRLLFTCSELGLGHVSRIIPLGKRLKQAGHEVFFLSGGKPYDLLKKEFKFVYNCMPITWYENTFGIIIPASIVNMIAPLPVFNSETHKFEIKNSNAMEIIHRSYDLRAKMCDINPDVLIADGDITALRMAAKSAIPSVYITNFLCPKYGLVQLLNVGKLLADRYVKQTAKIVIPDNPQPYTISGYNIGNLRGSPFETKIEYVGAFMDTTLIQGMDEHIFASVSGPIGTRSKILKTLLPVLQKSSTKTIISLGIPGKKTFVKINNCEIHSWLTTVERQVAMKNAKYVIFSGGHITCFETIKYAKPSICIPTQLEQNGNATKLCDLRCSFKAKNQKELINAMHEMDKNFQNYKKNILELSHFSSKFSGLDRTVEIIENI